MKKGYRFNSAIAYANYCADVNNVANFNRFGGMVDAVKGRAKGLRQGIGSLAQEADRQVMRVGSDISRLGATRRFDKAAQAGRELPLQAPMRPRNARALGYGTLGAAGIAGSAAAGYGGYRALRPKQEEEDMY